MTIGVRNSIVERYLPLARFVANKYARNRDEFDDYAQVGAEALIGAVTHFRDDRGCSFPTYALAKVTWAIKDLPRFRSLGVLPHRPKDALTREPHGDLREWQEPSAGSEAQVVDAIDLLAAIGALPTSQRFVIRHHQKGETDGEIGAALHLCGSRIGQIHAAALAVLREDLSR